MPSIQVNSTRDPSLEEKRRVEDQKSLQNLKLTQTEQTKQTSADLATEEKKKQKTREGRIQDLQQLSEKEIENKIDEAKRIGSNLVQFEVGGETIYFDVQYLVNLGYSTPSKPGVEKEANPPPPTQNSFSQTPLAQTAATARTLAANPPALAVTGSAPSLTTPQMPNMLSLLQNDQMRNLSKDQLKAAKDAEAKQALQMLQILQALMNGDIAQVLNILRKADSQDCIKQSYILLQQRNQLTTAKGIVLTQMSQVQYRESTSSDPKAQSRVAFQNQQAQQQTMMLQQQLTIYGDAMRENMDTMTNVWRENDRRWDELLQVQNRQHELNLRIARAT